MKRDILDGQFSRTQIRLFLLFVIVTFGFLASYLVSYIINGGAYTNMWVTDNALIIAYFYSFAVAVIPVYSRLDDRADKALKQFTSAALIIGLASLFVALYSFWAVDPSPFQEAVFWFAQRVFGVTFFGIFTSVFLLKKNGD